MKNLMTIAINWYVNDTIKSGSSSTVSRSILANESVNSNGEMTITAYMGSSAGFLQDSARVQIYVNGSVSYNAFVQYGTNINAHYIWGSNSSFYGPAGWSFTLN